jgi:hypothetical protein
MALPPSPWCIPGVAEVRLEVITETGEWVDTSLNPAILESYNIPGLSGSGGQGSYATTAPRHIPINPDLGTVCTFQLEEQFRVRVVSFLPGVLSVRVFVDSASVRSTGSGVAVSPGPKGLLISGFKDVAADTTMPFCLKKLQVIEGNSQRAWAAGADSMQKVGKIQVDVFSAKRVEEKMVTKTIAGSAGTLETSEKKSLLNGTGASAPVFAAGKVTKMSSKWKADVPYGKIIIHYRDPCAVLREYSLSSRPSPPPSCLPLHSPFSHT